MMSIEDADTFVHGQFLRIQSYARVASKKAQQVENARAAKKGKPPKTIWNSSEVIAEALRDEGACGHVKAPEPPTFHYGDEKRMRGLVAELDGYANAIHARTGKRLRKDTAHMLAGVLSYPDDAPKDRYPEWRARSIKWLKKRYGRHLVAVLEHLDENNPHLHFYAIEPKGLDVKAIHEGWTAKKDGQDYRDAMRLVQDDYHRDVSAWVGLTRIGPGRKRLERDEYMAMKADAEQTRTMLRDIVNNQLIPRMVKHGFPIKGLRFEWDDAVDYTPEQQVAYETMVADRYEVDPSYFAEKYSIPVGERRNAQPMLPTGGDNNDGGDDGNSEPQDDKKKQQQNAHSSFFD